MSDTTIDPLIQELFEKKAYIGHIKRKTHPKAKKAYIFKIENNIALIDLSKTIDYLKKAKEFAKSLGKENKTILFVGTKQNIGPIIKELCQQHNLMYINKKWLPGLLTNFDTLKKNIERLNKLTKEYENNAWSKRPKHERIKLEKEMKKLEQLYGGIKNINNIPSAIYVVDIKKEQNAVNEALKLHIPTIAITDTNVDPSLIDYPIPANDDFAEVVRKITEEIIISYLEGKKNAKKS
ncbi:MAG: 30S ribosomal protein S2 [Patescibacteria group bacterium]|nr:MAG: 30S ribosomal protein S2 [Patescibacteria group bacterium]